VWTNSSSTGQPSQRKSRRAQATELLTSSGLLGALWGRLEPGVYVFNYHRIGSPEETPFDPNVFSCDIEHFRRHVELVTSRFRVINTAELVSLMTNGGKIDAPLAMFTFDDGYRDNFTGAYPVLRDAGISASFFLPTAFIGTREIQWWDEIAWLVKHTDQTSLTADFLQSPLSIDRGDIATTIRKILTAFKRAPGVGADKVADIRANLKVSVPQDQIETLTLSWDDAREMAANGMDIGSHSHTHRILSHLSVDEQKDELRRSKDALEQELSAPVTSIAYPVGAIDSFTHDTEEIARSCGYQVGFSFIPGYQLSTPVESIRPTTSRG
jgi:peptidoglycan/xylan/chitin deacetylase (PgdA/CDA1 family)